MKSNPFTCKTYECETCHAVFLDCSSAKKHTNRKECSGAKMIEGRKTIEHFDESARSVMLHQCSECGLTAPLKSTIAYHVSKVHPNAQMVSEKRSFAFKADTPTNADTPATGPTTNNADGGKAGQAAAGCRDVTQQMLNVFVIVAPGSDAERLRIAEVMERNRQRIFDTMLDSPEKVPALIARLTVGEGGEPDLQNVYVKNNDVVNKLDKTDRTPLGKYSKRKVDEAYDACFDVAVAPDLEGDTDVKRVEVVKRFLTSPSVVDDGDPKTLDDVIEHDVYHGLDKWMRDYKDLEPANGGTLPAACKAVRTKSGEGDRLRRRTNHRALELANEARRLYMTEMRKAPRLPRHGRATRRRDATAARNRRI